MTVLSGLSDLNAKRRTLNSLRRSQDLLATIIDNPYDPASAFSTVKGIADQLALSRVVLTVACAVCTKPLEVVYRVGEDGTPSSALCSECNDSIEEMQ